jgi:hypothetical protein
MNGNSEEEVKRLRSRYLELDKNRRRFKFSIHHKLKFPLVWFIFFAVVGIIQQSISSGKLVFLDFLGKNYINWFASFGNFQEVYMVSSTQDLFIALISQWYYFFLTGGLISVLWAVVYLLLHIERQQKDPLLQQ